MILHKSTIPVKGRVCAEDFRKLHQVERRRVSCSVPQDSPSPIAVRGVEGCR